MSRQAGAFHSLQQQKSRLREQQFFILAEPRCGLDWDQTLCGRDLGWDVSRGERLPTVHPPRSFGGAPLKVERTLSSGRSGAECGRIRRPVLQSCGNPEEDKNPPIFRPALAARLRMVTWDPAAKYLGSDAAARGEPLSISTGSRNIGSSTWATSSVRGIWLLVLRNVRLDHEVGRPRCKGCPRGNVLSYRQEK